MTRNQGFTETIETIRTSGLTLIISTIRFFKTFTAEFRFNNFMPCKESNSKFQDIHIFYTNIIYFNIGINLVDIKN